MAPLQAEDRCHRLGQRKPVTVIRLITQDTVDEDIHAIAQRKLRLDAAVLEGLGEGAVVNGTTGGKGGSEAKTMGVILKAIIAGRSLAADSAQAATADGEAAAPVTVPLAASHAGKLATPQLSTADDYTIVLEDTE